jgi:thermostable 8-oxoguanine DNA glycosylase
MGPDRQFIQNNLDYYSKTQGVLPERLERFGEKYREQGFLTKDQLYDIAYESSTRSAYHVEKNPEQRCRNVTANVIEVEDDFSKIALIESLKGFKAPTASCVLASLDPERHAVVDTRVWASLERLGYFDDRKESFDASDYVEMIEPIREISDRTGFSTVKVGYALFAYDDRVRDGTLH